MWITLCIHLLYICRRTFVLFQVVTHFKPSARAAWQNQSIAAYRKPDLIRCHFAAKRLPYRQFQHIRQYRRLQTGCIGIDQKEQGIFGQNLCAKIHKRKDFLLNLPDFPFRSSSIRWWIHDNPVIMISAADFALNKFHAVVHKIADRRICKSGCRRIFPPPGGRRHFRR